MGKFTFEGNESYNPEYGGIQWKRRFNNWAEENDITYRPVFYYEKDGPKMQVTQENTSVYLNSFADEMDGVFVDYDQDEEDIITPYFREQMGGNFKKIMGMIGEVALVHMSVYPLEEVVEAYIQMHQSPDFIPDDM